MFGSFYLGSCLELSGVKEIVERLFENAQVIDSKNSFTISTDGFTLSVKEGGPRVLFANEDYGANLKFDFYIDIIVSHTNWAHELIVFVGRLMKSVSGDCLLELNDKPILLRKDNHVIVDDSKLSGENQFPFYGLDLDFERGNLE